MHQKYIATNLKKKTLQNYKNRKTRYHSNTTKTIDNNILSNTKYRNNNVTNVI